jgi:hypothetical protein
MVAKGVMFAIDADEALDLVDERGSLVSGIIEHQSSLEPIEVEQDIADLEVGLVASPGEPVEIFGS